jgi:hypothetical protein
LLIPTSTLRVLHDIGNSGGNALTSVNLSMHRLASSGNPRLRGRLSTVMQRACILRWAAKSRQIE